MHNVRSQIKTQHAKKEQFMKRKSKQSRMLSPFLRTQTLVVSGVAFDYATKRATLPLQLTAFVCVLATKYFINPLASKANISLNRRDSTTVA